MLFGQCSVVYLSLISIIDHLPSLLSLVPTLHLLHRLQLIFALCIPSLLFTDKKNMHKESSHCWVVCHLLMVLWNYVSLHCHPSSSCQFSKLISCNRDLRQSSDFSLQYVIYMSLLTQQGFFLFAFLRSSMYQMLQVWLKHTLSCSL